MSHAESPPKLTLASGVRPLQGWATSSTTVRASDRASSASRDRWPSPLRGSLFTLPPLTQAGRARVWEACCASGLVPAAFWATVYSPAPPVPERKERMDTVEIALESLQSPPKCSFLGTPAR